MKSQDPSRYRSQPQNFADPCSLLEKHSHFRAFSFSALCRLGLSQVNTIRLTRFVPYAEFLIIAASIDRSGAAPSLCTNPLRGNQYATNSYPERGALFGAT